MSPLLPNNPYFNLGGLIRPAEVRSYNFTGSIPTNLPFTLSARTEFDTVEYGSIGWELICRSYRDFQMELLRTSDMTSLTFSKELNAYGQASFSLNLEHPMFKRPLADGSSVEDLFDYENLWEIRFDNTVVFQVLGTAVTDSQVNEGEMRTATVTGAGSAKVLEWAQVFPKGFPSNIVTKLETLVDDFGGGALDEDIWKYTIFSKVVSVNSKGAWQDAQDDLEERQQQLKQLQDERSRIVEEYSEQLIQLGEVYRDPESTGKQRQDESRKLGEINRRMQLKALQIAAYEKLIDQANARKNFIGAPKTEESVSKNRVRITLPDTKADYSVNNSEPRGFITSGTYDFDSSGISAAIEPGPSAPPAEGQVATYFQVIHDPGVFVDWHLSSTNFARMYTQRVSGNLKLVAEVASSGQVNNSSWSFNVADQKYWRIREDNGLIVFETSPDNEAWSRRFSSSYAWPSKNVVFQFGMSIKGNIGIGLPVSAYMYDLNVSALPSTETTMQVFRKYLLAAQARGVIPFVKTTFSNSHDSHGVAWQSKLGTDASEGTKLSDVLISNAQLQQADWYMDANFNLKAFQRSKSDSITPPVKFLKEDVVFHEAGSQLNKERSRNRDSVANYILGKNSAGEYAYTQDTSSISKYFKREAFISAGNASDLSSLGAVLDSTLEELKEEKTSWKVTVVANQPGRRVFKDYDIGDWIAIENINSKKEANIGIWRVVGIAVNVATDATTTVELTLQSRRELLIERLKQQVASLSASTGVASTTKLGSAISAATLIEQAKLAGLRDVMVNNAVDGDVLTYSKGYWIPVKPGDNTVPDAPNIASVNTNVYYASNGMDTRGQAEITWDLPTNIDGSEITDGHHFELRYRPDISGDYSATWAEAGDNLWNELYTWGQPTIPPILNSGWQTIYVPWGDMSVVLQELTPGLDYNIQIRAVDSATPQHFSEWSEGFTFSVAIDSVAPPRPAPPVVASSYLSIQVTHYLGREEGESFSLPSDMAHLEVHIGPAAFYPDDSTRIGKIIADQGLIRSRTPVVQTFTVDSTEDVYVRVIAVDQAGNKSAPSNAVTSSITLIDDAHISDLTASKITAGTINSSIILGGVIKTAEVGPRAEMNFEGFKIFSEDEDPTVSLLGSPDSNGNFLLIKDLEDPTATLASIDGSGRGSFQSVYVNDSIVLDGNDLMTDILEPRGKGVISIGTTSETVIGGGVGSGNERGFIEISFQAEEARTYMICAITEWESDTANDKLVLRLRDSGANNPRITSSWLQQSITPNVGSAAGNAAAQIIYSGTFTPGLHRILLSFYGTFGVATVNPDGSVGSSGNSTIFWVEDVGLPKTDTIIINDAGVPAYLQSSTVAPPTAKREYTKNYAATWSGTYRGNGGYASSFGNTMVQGNSGDTWLGDARSLCGFDYQAIMSDLRGATVKACYITMYANHWWWNTGGTAVIGTHDYTGRPSSWSTTRVIEQRINSTNWPKPGKRKVSLGTTIGNDFRTGLAKGIALGPTNGSKSQNGKMDGEGQANEPVLTLVYVK